MKKLVLIEVPPPYDTKAVDCDENNPNVWNTEIWNDWLKSVDLYITNWSKTLFSAEDATASDGHRGVRIGLFYETEATWYYNIKMGYKIEE
jgi:hypothetical protein